ncbi:TMV resistance protein N-like [Pistacia vera]|uniref:TMV resistance protein N-like n=1 Tax=Pistacia vera TaxID=55513 RepID=UPI0012633488|nr:TMV resistance protein N-like [Pistacia vera]
MSIVVFSRNYASCTWCLDEAVKIVQCGEEIGQTIIPIFYDVDPSTVRNQKRNFQKAFSKHEETFKENMEKVKRWRAALRKVADISGWDLKDRHESDFIKEIVTNISSKLSLPTCMDLKDLVNLKEGVFLLMLEKFKNKEMVIIVLDDVVNGKQLKKLVGSRDWFGLGSKIIITTRDEHLLKSHGIDEEHLYKVEELNHDHSIQLLSLKAFRNYQSPKDYSKLSECVVKYAG